MPRSRESEPSRRQEEAELGQEIQYIGPYKLRSTGVFEEDLEHFAVVYLDTTDRAPGYYIATMNDASCTFMRGTWVNQPIPEVKTIQEAVVAARQTLAESPLLRGPAR